MTDTSLPGLLLKGVAASRPAANAVGGGTLYSATDTGAITQSDGVSTWAAWATISGGMTNPMTTGGDVIYGGASGTPTRLANGSAGQVLTSAGTTVAPTWETPSAGGATGFVVAVLPIGMPLLATTTNSSPDQAEAIPIIVPAPMYVTSLQCNIQTSNTGVIRWGLFDYSASDTAATLLCGGSAAPGGTGWRAIAATGAPVLIAAGAYMLVTLNAAANVPIWQAAAITTAAPWNHFQAAYTWDDTPTFVTGWGAGNSTFRMCYLEGDLNVSGNPWQ